MDVDFERRAKLLERLRAGDSVSAAARAAGYARPHVYRAARSDPELDKVLRERAPTKAIKGKPSAVKPTKPAKVGSETSSRGATKKPLAPLKPADKPLQPSALMTADLGALDMVGLRTLKEVAENTDAPFGARVSAARELVRTAERRSFALAGEVTRVARDERDGEETTTTMRVEARAATPEELKAAAAEFFNPK